MRRSKLHMLAIALMMSLVGLAACNGNGGEEDTGTQDTGQMTDAGDTGGDTTADAADGTAGDADATTDDASDAGPTREECLGGEPLNIFCTGTVREECQQYCEDVDAGSPDGGTPDSGGSDGGS